MKLFNSKPLIEMSRDEIIDIILNTGTQKHLKEDINNASLEELIKVASITHAGDKGMQGMAKVFFYLGLILFALFIVSIFRAHWMQAVIELIIAVLSFAASSLLHIRRGIKSTKK